jgi:acyl-CoA synthetase (AMP-forming)/AMP-acid ligase II
VAGQIAIRVRQGIPAPTVERKVLDEHGEPVPWDDRTIGEVYVRGPWIATTYLDEPRSAESFIRMSRQGSANEPTPRRRRCRRTGRCT